MNWMTSEFAIQKYREHSQNIEISKGNSEIIKVKSASSPKN